MALDDHDTMLLNAARDLSALVARRMQERPETARPANPLPCYSAFGTALALRCIVNRGALVPGDLDAINAAARLLDAAHAEGVL